MQFMSLFGENRTFAFVLAAVCLLIGVALVFVLFRIVFGRGIKLPGGRSRQQRLGIVDAFEIDRQRQLVIVRRDNVEHLIMIGGPNDVVVESSIIRAEARPLPPFLSGRAKPAEQTPPAPGPTESADAEAAASHEGAAPAPAPEPAAPAPDGEAPEPQAAPEGQPSTAPKIELDPLESLE